MHTHTAVMFAAIKPSVPHAANPPIIALHPTPQPAVALSGGMMHVYMHNSSRTTPLDLTPFPCAVRAASSEQQEVHVLLQCSSSSNFALQQSVTAASVVVPCPLRDGNSSSSDGTAWIQLLQQWDADRLFNPPPPPDSLLDTPAASTGALSVTGMLQWSVCSAAAGGGGTGGTLVSFVLERPEASMCACCCMLVACGV